MPVSYRHSFHASGIGSTDCTGDGSCRARYQGREGIRTLPKIVKYPGSGVGVEVLPRTRRNHGCDNQRRTQESGGGGGGGGRKLPQVPQAQPPPQDSEKGKQFNPNDSRMRDSIHIAYENENRVEYKQRSLPRTPRDLEQDQATGIQKPPRRSPKRISGCQEAYHEHDTTDRKHSHRSQHQYSGSDEHHRRRPDEPKRSPGRSQDGSRRTDPKKSQRHSTKPGCDSRHRSVGGGQTRELRGIVRTGRSRMTRQSPVEDRLSIHEDESMSDAFDDDGLFQIDDDFAKFLDDKTSCQK